MTVTSDTLLSTTRHYRNQVTCRNDNDSLTIVYRAEPTVLLLTLEDKMRRLTHELLVKRHFVGDFNLPRIYVGLFLTVQKRRFHRELIQFVR